MNMTPTQARESLRKLEEEMDEILATTGCIPLDYEDEAKVLREMAGGWFVAEGIFQEFDSVQWANRETIPNCEGWR